MNVIKQKLNSVRLYKPTTCSHSRHKNIKRAYLSLSKYVNDTDQSSLCVLEKMTFSFQIEDIEVNKLITKLHKYITI